MKQKIFTVLAIGVFMFCMAGVAQATISSSWIADPISLYYGVNRATGGESVGAYTVTEIKYANYGNNSPWSGVTSGDPNNSGIWLFGNSVSTAFTTSSTALAFQAGGDHNDSTTNFYVDGQLVNTHNMYFFGGTLLVEGLANTAHTVEVSGTTHLAGAYELVPTNTSPVPIPGALLLFGPGLAGLAALRRRFTA